MFINGCVDVIANYFIIIATAKLRTTINIFFLQKAFKCLTWEDCVKRDLRKAEGGGRTMEQQAPMEKN